MFVGEYISKLDAKGRVIFPSSLKKQLPEDGQLSTFVLKRDIYEKCLVLYPKSEWDRQASILKHRLNPFNRRHAEFLREFYRGTAEVALDANSRILIPKVLLEYISADKDLVFAGMEGKVEIWAKDVYEKSAMTNDDFAEMAGSILGDESMSFDGGF